jgi:hypothetical protein
MAGAATPNILVIWADDIAAEGMRRTDSYAGQFPPRQKAASFTIDQALDKLEAAMTAHR